MVGNHEGKEEKTHEVPNNDYVVASNPAVIIAPNHDVIGAPNPEAGEAPKPDSEVSSNLGFAGNPDPKSLVVSLELPNPSLQ